jgi:hypothetical protein
MASDTTVAVAGVVRVSRVRRIAFRAVGALLALALAVSGGRLLVSGWFDARDGGIHRFHDLSWGVIEGVILLAAVAAQLRKPGRHVAAMQQAVAGLGALLVTMVVTLSPDPVTLVAGILIGVLVVLHPTRAGVLRLRAKVDVRRLVLAFGGSAALVAYGLHQSGLMRSAPADDPYAQAAGYAGACAAAFGIALVALLAAVRGDAGLPAWSAPVGALVLGVGSIVFPLHESSLGGLGGLIAVGAALLYMLATLATLRRSAEPLSPERAPVATATWSPVRRE